MRLFLTLALALLAPIVGAQDLNLTMTPGLPWTPAIRVWLDATEVVGSAGNPVSPWNNRMDYNNNGVYTTRGGAVATYQVNIFPGSKPAIYYQASGRTTGANHTLNALMDRPHTTYVVLLDPAYIEFGTVHVFFGGNTYAIYNDSTTSNNREITAYNPAGDNRTVQQVYQYNVAFCVCVTYDTGNVTPTIYTNNVVCPFSTSTASTTGGSMAGAPVTIGSGTSAGLIDFASKVYIGEVLVYAEVHDAVTRTKINGYLRTKWGF